MNTQTGHLQKLFEEQNFQFSNLAKDVFKIWNNENENGLAPRD